MLGDVEHKEFVLDKLFVFVHNKALELTNLDYDTAVDAVIARLYSVDEMNKALNGDVEVFSIKPEKVFLGYSCSKCGDGKQVEVSKGDHMFNCPTCGRAFDVVWFADGNIAIREQGV